MSLQLGPLYVVVKIGPGRIVKELAFHAIFERVKIAAEAFVYGGKNKYVPNPREGKGTSWLGHDGATVYTVLDTRHGTPRKPFTYEEIIKLISKPAKMTYDSNFGPTVITPEIV